MKTLRGVVMRSEVDYSRELPKYALILLIGMVALLLQGSILASLLPDHYTPNLLLVVVIAVGVAERNIGGLILCFLLGLELDLSSGLLIGPWTGACTFIYLVLFSLSQRVFVDTPIAMFGVTFIMSCVGGGVYHILSYVVPYVAGSTPSLNDISTISIKEAASTALVAPIVFMMIRRRLWRTTTQLA